MTVFTRPILFARIAALWFCTAPLFITFMLLVYEPSQYEAVLSIGVAALMFLSAAINLSAAFLYPFSRASWLFSLLGTSAAALCIGSFAYLAHRTVNWVFAALLVIPPLITAAQMYVRTRPTPQPEPTT